MRQIVTFPLWVIVLASLTIRRPKMINTIWLSRYAALLEELYQALPVPRTWFERWAVTTLIQWIDREKEAALKLVQLKAVLLLF